MHHISLDAKPIGELKVYATVGCAKVNSMLRLPADKVRCVRNDYKFSGGLLSNNPSLSIALLK